MPLSCLQCYKKKERERERGRNQSATIDNKEGVVFRIEPWGGWEGEGRKEKEGQNTWETKIDDMRQLSRTEVFNETEIFVHTDFAINEQLQEELEKSRGEEVEKK